ncbi:hypothetical protein K8R62_02400 [bacterium]|nr:hypothetical protein [bacterium]
MIILLPQIYFQAQKDEEGNLFGCFYGRELFSDPIYSQEMAHKVFREIKKAFNLSVEEKRAVEVCIENTKLPILSSEQELIKMRVNSIETDLLNVFNIISSPTKDQEIEKNCIDLKKENETTPLN